jgi:hypothetical protein
MKMENQQYAPVRDLFPEIARYYYDLWIRMRAGRWIDLGYSKAENLATRLAFWDYARGQIDMKTHKIPDNEKPQWIAFIEQRATQCQRQIRALPRDQRTLSQEYFLDRSSEFALTPF